MERLNNLMIRPWVPSLDEDDEEGCDLLLELPPDLANTVNLYSHVDCEVE